MRTPASFPMCSRVGERGARHLPKGIGGPRPIGRRARRNSDRHFHVLARVFTPSICVEGKSGVAEQDARLALVSREHGTSPYDEEIRRMVAQGTGGAPAVCVRRTLRWADALWEPACVLHWGAAVAAAWSRWAHAPANASRPVGLVLSPDGAMLAGARRREACCMDADAARHRIHRGRMFL